MKKDGWFKSWKVIETLSNKIRLNILLYSLRDQKEGIKITELKEILEKKMKRIVEYSTLAYHLNILKDLDLVSTDRKQNVKGRPTYVKINLEKLPIIISLGKEKYTVLREDGVYELEDLSEVKLNVKA